MGHLSRSLENGVSSFEAQELHIGLSFDDFLLSCVGFCEGMLSIIKDKIEFSSEMFLLEKVGKPQGFRSGPRPREHIF